MRGKEELQIEWNTLISGGVECPAGEQH